MQNGSDERILTDAQIVLSDMVIENGWVAFAGGRIVDLGEGRAPGARGESVR